MLIQSEPNFHKFLRTRREEIATKGTKNTKLNQMRSPLVFLTSLMNRITKTRFEVTVTRVGTSD